MKTILKDKNSGTTYEVEKVGVNNKDCYVSGNTILCECEKANQDYEVSYDFTKDKEHFSAVIEERLKQLEIRKVNLSRLTGISRSLIDGYLSGKKSPTIETLIKLSDALDMEIVIKSIK